MMTRFAAFLLTVSVLPFAALADELPVTKVILSTSGLAHFEMRAKAEGNAALAFPVRLEQVDDVLKSLVVFDPKGRLGGVTLPGRQPLSETFRDLPFTQDQLGSPALLLNAYQGAEVSVKGPELTATGKILRVDPETSQLKDGAVVTRHRLSLMTADGIRQAVIEDLQSVQFTDARPKAEIARALDSVRENAASGRRLLTVNLPGAGARDVALSYVVSAPLWKTAYRMVLPKDRKDKGLLQGWAVIENMTASDWKDVDLTLVSGNPVTYRQALYPSYYVERPELPVQVFGRVMPRVDQGAVGTADGMEGDQMAPARRGALMKAKNMMAEMAAPAPAMMAMDAGGVTGGMPPPAPQGMDQIARAANVAAGAEGGTQVLFRFPQHFDLKSGQSMMLPFVSREVPLSRVSLYQPETHATHPLAAVEIANDGDTGLPPGIVTLYEDSALLEGLGFTGDAQLPALEKGGKRLVSYALDSKTKVSMADLAESSEGRVTVSGGVLNAAVVNRMETDYTVKAPEAEARTVVIEHPKAGGDYKIVKPDPKDIEVTDTHYRMRVKLKAGETVTVPLVLENEVWQSWSIDAMPADQLLAYAGGRGGLDAGMRKTFEALAKMRRDMDGLDRAMAELERQRQVIFEDQARVRENLKSLTDKSDAKEKYLEKLSAQEDALADLDVRIEKMRAERAEKIADMQKEIAEIGG